MDLSFIHRYHLLLKSHYFLFCSAFGIIFPILNLTLRSHGLSNTEISFSNIILPFLIFLTSPLIGFIADKSRRFLFTFNIIFIISIITLTGLFFLPYIQSYHIQADLHYFEQSKYVLDFCASQEVATKCSSRSECGCSYQAFCKKENKTFNFTFTMNSYDIQKELNDDQSSQCGIDYRIPIEKNFLEKNQIKKFSQDYENFLMIKCEIICSIPHFCHGLRYSKQLIYIVLYSILYIIGATLLSTSNAVGASIGFASLSNATIFGKQRVWGTVGFGILAFLTSRLYEKYHSEYVYVIMFNIVSVLTIVVTSFIHIPQIEITEDKKKQTFDSSALMSLFKNVDVLIFLSITFVWGMGFGCLQPYIFLYIDEITPCHSRSIIGWMSLISATFEVIAFYFSSRFIKFFAPTGLSGTLQGIAHGVTHGLGRGIGMLVSSFIYIIIQQRLLFLVFAILNLVAAIIYSIYFLLTRTKTSRKNLTIPNDAIETDIPLNQETFPSSTETNNNNDQ